MRRVPGLGPVLAQALVRALPLASAQVPVLLSVPKRALVRDRASAWPPAMVLAREIAAFPQACLRGDRAAMKAQWGLDEQQALALEFEYGRKTLASGETVAGAQRFAGGEGRGGRFGD